MIRVNLFKINQQVAKGARSTVLKDSIIHIIRYILLSPLALVSILLLGIVFLLIVIVEKTQKYPRSLKRIYRDFEPLSDALRYFSKETISSLWNIYILEFECETCGEYRFYSESLVDEKELPLWDWIDSKKKMCYECSKKETK